MNTNDHGCRRSPSPTRRRRHRMLFGTLHHNRLRMNRVQSSVYEVLCSMYLLLKGFSGFLFVPLDYAAGVFYMLVDFVLYIFFSIVSTALSLTKGVCEYVCETPLKGALVSGRASTRSQRDWATTSARALEADMAKDAKTGRRWTRKDAKKRRGEGGVDRESDEPANSYSEPRAIAWNDMKVQIARISDLILQRATGDNEAAEPGTSQTMDISTSTESSWSSDSELAFPKSISTQTVPDDRSSSPESSSAVDLEPAQYPPEDEGAVGEAAGSPGKVTATQTDHQRRAQSRKGRYSRKAGERGDKRGAGRSGSPGQSSPSGSSSRSITSQTDTPNRKRRARNKRKGRKKKRAGRRGAKLKTQPRASPSPSGQSKLKWTESKIVDSWISTIKIRAVDLMKYLRRKYLETDTEMKVPEREENEDLDDGKTTASDDEDHHSGGAWEDVHYDMGRGYEEEEDDHHEGAWKDVHYNMHEKEEEDDQHPEDWEDTEGEEYDDVDPHNTDAWKDEEYEMGESKQGLVFTQSDVAVDTHSLPPGDLYEQEGTSSYMTADTRRHVVEEIPAEEEEQIFEEGSEQIFEVEENQ